VKPTSLGSTLDARPSTPFLTYELSSKKALDHFEQASFPQATAGAAGALGGDYGWAAYHFYLGFAL
jgi:hypothetical protein